MDTLPTTPESVKTPESLLASGLHWLGYGELDVFISRINPDRIIPCLLVAEKRERQGMGEVALYVECSQVDDLGIIHYCRIPAATYSTAFGKDFGSDCQERRDAAQTLYEMIRKYLFDCNLEPVPAVHAKPRDLVLLDGSFSLIRYDQGLKTYIWRKDRP
ncbi:MAG: hypothetical protein A2W00_04620 [Candidatus Eisenbacteria bacterium RBG_16_71_46]|nr:MAG: hypothetical protein A2W00_04620 [Candidatus Eisenbacteria bacterium RBG_16_71_46]